MTDIDPKADIELHTVNEHVIVRVPLAGPVTDEWLRRYQRLTQAAGSLAVLGLVIAGPSIFCNSLSTKETGYAVL